MKDRNLWKLINVPDKNAMTTDVEPTELQISVVGIIVEKYLPPYGMQRSVDFLSDSEDLSNGVAQASSQLLRSPRPTGHFVRSFLLVPRPPQGADRRNPCEVPGGFTRHDHISSIISFHGDIFDDPGNHPFVDATPLRTNDPGGRFRSCRQS